MSQIGEDCFFFYYSTCNKGPACPFRHVEAARGSEVECPLWRQGQCFQPNCGYRHMELIKNRQMIPCYYEGQPGGCTKPHCPFLHTQPKLNVPPPSLSGPPPVRPPVAGPHPAPPHMMGPPRGPAGGPPPSLPAGPPVSGPPPVSQAVRPHIMGPPPPHLWRGPPPQGPPPQGPPPPFHTFPPGPRPGLFVPEPEGVRMIMVPRVEPVIVNINSEESESDGSPVKPIRVVAPNIRKSLSDTSLIHPELHVAEHNPLDYFLGAKPWVDPNPPDWDDRRSPSPTGRQMSPIRFQVRRNGSLSPARSRGSLSPPRNRGSLSPVRARGSLSPVRSRGSLSPDRSRRRSASEERRRPRPLERRRSRSLDRSRSPSPDWGDRPRGRSPVKPRSRSPIGRRPFRGPVGSRRSPPRRFGRNVQRFPDRRPRPVPEKVKLPVQPVIVPTGPKIISTKKEKKDEEKKEEEETEKKETEEKNEEESGNVPLTEVRSLEDIYREKALRSMMEAKKKKVIENRRQKLAERAKQVKQEHPEIVKSDKSEDEKSDGEKSQKDSSSDKEQSADSDSESCEEEKEVEESGTEVEEEEEEGGAKDGEKAESDIDLADDVDIEVEAGDKGTDDDAESESDRSDVNKEHSDSEGQKTDSSEKEKAIVEKRRKAAKSSIKSRLGMKANKTEVPKRKQASAIAVKDRLGSNAPRPSIKDRLGKREDVLTDRAAVRSGVIKLNRDRPREIPDTRSNIRTNRLGYGRNDDYGKDKDIMMVPKIVVRNRPENFDPDYEHSRESFRSRHDYDDSESDYDQDSDSDDEIISKLTKRKKKLKKMLESEGSDYDEIELLKREKRKIKKLLKRKKDKKEKRRKERRRRERKERDYSDDEAEIEERSRRRIKIQSRLGPAKEESDRSEEELKEEDENLSEEEQIHLEEEEKSRDQEVEEKEELSEAEIQARERLRQEKQQKLQAALQPKTLEDIRRERAGKKTFEPKDILAARVKKSEGSGRRIMLAEEKEPSPPKQQVRITFNEEPKQPVRPRIRLKRDTEQNENKLPAADSVKTFKRERQIYLPPGRKRTDEPDTDPAIKRPTDREIVDYGDMYPSKKPKPAVETTTEASPATTIQLKKPERRPPKVEIENAGIKSFAEIMAEKKRKRLLAQQESKKNITPVVFDDKPDSGSSVTSRLTPDLRSRLSPVDESLSSGTNSQSNFSMLSSKPLQISRTVGAKTDTISSVKTDSNSQSSPVRTSSPVNNPVGIKRTITPTKSVVSELNTQKPTRWKRRKANMGTNEETSVSVSSSGESLAASTAESAKDIQKIEEDNLFSTVTSDKERRTSTGTEKKSAKVSDSLLDFEDELLADVDLNLDDEKSHDELMREMEELLA